MKFTHQWMIRRGQIPLDPINRHATNPLETHVWLSYERARDIANDPTNSADGVGFVLTKEDNYFFIDIDDCYVNGSWTPLAIDVCSKFSGAWIETSHSGTGIHIYGQSEHIPDHSCKNNDFGIELYTHSKHVHVTHLNATGDGDLYCTEALLQLCDDYFPPNASFEGDDWTEGPRDDWDGYTDDNELIGAACRAVSAGNTFAGTASFGDLWDAREEPLARNYPDSGGRSYGASEADAALAQHLAFWTGCDCDRINRLMRQSKLARDKWDDRGDYYLPRTIMRACELQDEVFAKPSAPVVDEETPTLKIFDGYQYLNPGMLHDYLGKCIYVTEAHRMLVPGGRLLDSSRFNATYGGYVFALDGQNEKTTTKAWDAFTESRAVKFLKVDAVAFKPDRPPLDIFTQEGTTLANIYHPTDVDSRPGDVTPFLTHLSKLLPDERDAQMLLSYMAACVQHKGIKFQWCPLIQGAEGNGKTLLSYVVAAAIGKRYTHFPKASQMDSEFNGWVFNKIFIGVEDIYIPEKKAHVMEILKPLITSTTQEVRVMYQDGVCLEVCCNFILNSNHKDAVRKTGNDRRIAPFYTAHQCAEDIVSDGMTGSYFTELYAWLRADGFAHCTYYLENYKIQHDMNPATGCQRAPETSSTSEAIVASLGSIEQAILEAVGEGRQGFAGDWVSSVQLDELLSGNRSGRFVPQNKRRDLMQSIGYDYHPELPQGRVTSASMIDDMKRPRLFLRKGSIAANITDPAAILLAYLQAQNAVSLTPNA